MSDTDKIIENNQIVDFENPQKAPTYKVHTEGTSPLEGMTFQVNPDILGNRFNTVDIDVTNEDAVNQLAEDNPDAWETMYKDGSEYTYSTQNAYKLIRAVEYYMWLKPEEYSESNVFTNDHEKLDYEIEQKTTHRVQVPYSEFMTNPKWSEFRIPLDIMYSRDFENDVSAISPIPHYYDSRGYAIEVVDVVVSSTDASGGLSKSYTYKDGNGNTVTLYMHYVDQNGNIVPLHVPVYAPFLLESARTVRAKYHKSLLNRGDNGFDETDGTWKGFSKEYLDLKSHQVGHKATPSPYDWGGEHAAGKFGFPN